MDVTVVVATYGSQEWAALARGRALPSVPAGVPTVHVHSAGQLHDARNEGLAAVETEWVCFLDADDELEAGYFEAMAEASADLRAPAVAYLRRGRRARPYVPRVAGHTHDCTGPCLEYGNFLVVGTVARAGLLRSVAGWRDFPWSEDWDLWLRCYQAGASVEAVPRAVYRAHVRQGSRNRGPSRSFKLDAHRSIARANGVPVPA